MTSKINTSAKSIFIAFLLFAFFLFFSNSTFANDGPEQETSPHAESIVSQGHEAHGENSDKPVDIATVAFEHILDSHSWHFWGDGHDAVSLALPVILKTDNGIACFMSSEFHHDIHGMVVAEKDGQRFVNLGEDIYYASESPNEKGQYITYSKNEKGEEVISNAKPLDFSITKNVTQLFLSALVLILLFTSVAKAYKKTGVTSAPQGKQSFLEPLIVFVRDDLAKGNIGPKGEKFAPYLLTVFFIILINNIFGLVPISANLTGNIAFTLVLSVFTLLLTVFNGNKHYWGHIFTPHAPKALWIILIPIEIIGIFTKPFALMIRLFANISAGHIIIISLVGLIFMFKSLLISPIAVGFALFIDVLEVLVAVLQAYIFTLLTALFIGSAVADVNEDGQHDVDDEKLAAAGKHH
ncbi:MAG: F0F1 ATP synthase subunit A [Bacteroidia bacterium]